MRSLGAAFTSVATDSDLLQTRCLSVSASPPIRVDQVVEMTAKTDIQIMSVILSTVHADKSARISRFSSATASGHSKHMHTSCCTAAAACNRTHSLLAKYTMHFCTNSECMACRLKYMGIKGWGLVVLHAVKAGSFVVEYIGGCHHLQHARTPYVYALI